MARSTRPILDNAIYHIMVRGNQKQPTFLEEEDFTTYLDLLKHYKRKFRFSLYGFCLMPNHVHLVIELSRGKELSKIMQGMNQSYTVWFNDKYAKVGHQKNVLLDNPSFTGTPSIQDEKQPSDWQ